MNIKIYGISDLVLTNYNFISYRQEEYMGLRLPICVLTVLGNKDTILGLKKDIIIQMEIESEAGIIDTLIFTLKDYAHAPYKDNTNSVISLFMIHKYKEYVDDKLQYSRKGSVLSTINDTLKDLKLTLKYQDVLETDLCKQTWVRPNTSIKAFLRNLIHHLYIAEDNAILSAITLKDGVILAPMKELLDTKIIPDLKLGRDKNDTYDLYTVLQFETEHGLGDHIFGRSKILSILNSVTNDTTHLDFKGVEIFEGEEDSNAYISSSVVNNGNCHESYYKAESRNRTAWVSLDSESLLIRLTTDHLRFDIPILGTVDIYASEEDEMYLPFEGRHIITAKYIGVQANGGYTYLLLQRPAIDYFKKV